VRELKREWRHGDGYEVTRTEAPESVCVTRVLQALNERQERQRLWVFASGGRRSTQEGRCLETVFNLWIAEALCKQTPFVSAPKVLPAFCSKRNQKVNQLGSKGTVDLRDKFRQIFLNKSDNCWSSERALSGGTAENGEIFKTKPVNGKVFEPGQSVAVVLQ
jgi:hypothetical protein